MPRFALACAGAALAGLALAGCQSAPPAPAPTPTFTCTPEAGGDPFPCSQFQHDEMVAKDALYTEAEAVYRRFLAEDVRIMRAGGVSEPTKVLLETTTGAFLEDALLDYRQLKRDGTTARGEDPDLVWVRREPGKSKMGSQVAMSTCVDGRGLEFRQADRAIGTGRIARDVTYFSRVKGDLKVIGADGEQVTSCG